MAGHRRGRRRRTVLAAVVLLALVRPSEENFRDFVASPGVRRAARLAPRAHLQGKAHTVGGSRRRGGGGWAVLRP